MSSSEKVTFLTNMKLIYEHGVSHSRNKSKLHLLLAIHNCHYVSEQILREWLTDQTFEGGVLRDMGFEKIIKKAHEIKNIQNYESLLELNKIRNNAEHFFIIPSIEDVRAYIKITSDFLRWSYLNYFGIDYESLVFENMIHDIPIRAVMLQAKSFIESGNLLDASKAMYGCLGAFKFIWFNYLSDPRVMGHVFETSFGKITFTNLLADLAFKIILGEDEPTLRKMMLIGTDFTMTDKGLGVHSNYPVSQFKDKEEASQHYEDILNIILAYQDRVPILFWREK